MAKQVMLIVVLAVARLLVACGGGSDTPATEKMCSDGLDNDGDGMVDCADPDCAGLSACNESSDRDITAFSFTDAANAALSADVTATINGSDIAATVPAGTTVTALIPTFASTGLTVTVAGVVQESGVTPHDFSNPVTYVVSAENGATRVYTVTVTVAGGSAKDLTAFSFTDAANAALTADVTATINGTAISATVPAGTAVTALVATFTTTGTGVKVGAITQTSGVTVNDFTNAVSYVVSAGDGSTKTYTVTVTVAAGTAKDLTAFSFTDAANAALSADVTATITGTAIAATVPAGTDVTALVATFTTTGASVKVGGTTQVSGTTANDFTNPVTYTVTAADTTTKTYTVTVTVAAGTAKDLTAFSFTDAANSALSADVTATITGTAIAATVPAGTDVTALIATFTTTGASVKVGATTQASGITPNNFTSPVMYTVTAADLSTKVYTVTVTVAASAAKDLTAFSFTDAANAALSADVTATITGTAIAATVPAGTDVTALVATFATTGASVKIGPMVQASGITANNFTSAVTYTVTAADNSTKVYTVTVTPMASAAKDITAFSFTDAANAALTMDVTGTVSASSIAVSVPAGTNVSALVATFTTSGASVKVGGTTQVSGTTANDFSSPVTYTVTAADTTTKTYAVTVTVQSAATVIPDGTYTWGTWICTTQTQTIDIKAFMINTVGIMEVRETVNGSVGNLQAVYSPTCIRTVDDDIVYPAPGTVSTTTATSHTCDATCPSQACTPGTDAPETDTYAFTLGTGSFAWSRVYPSNLGGTPASFAGCMPGDVESGTYIKL